MQNVKNLTLAGFFKPRAHMLCLDQFYGEKNANCARKHNAHCIKNINTQLSQCCPILPKITPLITHLTLLIPIKSNFTLTIPLKGVQNVAKSRFTTKCVLVVPTIYPSHENLHKQRFACS